MPSLKARMILFLLQNRHLLRLRPQGKPGDWNTYEGILRFRREVEEGAARMGKVPAGIEVSPVVINQRIPAEWITPSPGAEDRVILYFHGGGYVSGTCQAHRPIVAKFVKGSGVGALVFDYRLAPEDPFPAALDDAVEAYRWLLDQGFSPSGIVFAGDSGGGGLCLATLIALRDQGISLPAAAVVLSPWTDLKCTGESYRTKAGVCLSPEGTWTAFSRHYAGDSDPGLPWISPLYGNLHGLPPLLIYVGGEEILLNDSTRFAVKAQAAGVDVTLRVGEGLFHCYPAMAPLFPEARQAMDEICAFIRNHSGGNPLANSPPGDSL